MVFGRRVLHGFALAGLSGFLIAYGMVHMVPRGRAAPVAAWEGRSVPGALAGAVAPARAPGRIRPSAAAVVIWRVATGTPDVALTFDDGPDPTNTPVVLAALRRYHAVATFFVLGRQAERYPELTRAMAQGGSEVCSHGYAHTMLRGQSPAAVTAEVERTATVLRRIGVGGCRLFRFPYFASDETARHVVAALGYRAIAASVDPQDWRGGTGQRIARQVFAELRPGDIILLHDGGGRRRATLAGLDLILAGLADRGLQTVTVTQLLADARGRASSVAAR